jgi:hypothetical protein
LPERFFGLQPILPQQRLRVQVLAAHGSHHRNVAGTALESTAWSRSAAFVVAVIKFPGQSSTCLGCRRPYPQ